jgi:hypothetical protein
MNTKLYLFLAIFFSFFKIELEELLKKNFHLFIISQYPDEINFNEADIHDKVFLPNTNSISLLTNSKCKLIRFSIYFHF